MVLNFYGKLYLSTSLMLIYRIQVADFNSPDSGVNIDFSSMYLWSIIIPSFIGIYNDG